MSQIKFVYFDLGDVLFEWEDNIGKIAVLANKSKEDVFAAFDKYNDDACRGKITPQEMWDHLKEDLSMQIDIKDFINWWTDNFKAIQSMHRVVEKASEKFKVGLLTNIYLESLVHNFAKGQVPDISYASIVQSCELGFIKPDKEIFEHAQKISGVLAGEIMFIDNSQKNIDKAKELGWQTAWYDVADPQKSEDEIKHALGINSNNPLKQ